ncbi:SMI1/KNR4 family protein [Fictibacillus sp. UD]|uniref:SMI1/KNR4 family protein n=1 Tax=Fictibacillus sp. UD TaxID=3038777 RepID=UPI00374530D3
MSHKYLNNQDLIPFFEEINKYAEDVHYLKAGANLEEIESLEKELNINLPQIYKDFLQVCNGGELFVPGTVLSEIYLPKTGPKQKGESYLNDSFEEDRRLLGMPNSYLIIADMNYGDTINFDLQTSNGYDAKVIQWDKEMGDVSRSWDGLASWLMDALDEGSMLVDYEGNDKDLDF